MATCQIDVLRQSEDQMFAEPDGVANVAPRTTVASGVPAALTSPGFSTSSGATGQQTVTSWRLYCDPTDLRYTDVVVDRTTGQAFSVDAVARRSGLGMDYLVAQVHQVQGLAS